MNRNISIISLIIALTVSSVSSLPSRIRIGGLFDNEDREQEYTFQLAVDRINSDPDILGSSRILAQSERLGKEDCLRVNNTVCSLLNEGVAGIFGPQSDVTSMHVHSICDALDVPHIETRWDFQLKRDDLSINFYPRHSTMAQAYMDIVKAWGWKRFSIVYEEDEAIIRVEDFLKEATVNNWKIYLYQLKSNETFRDIFWKIKQFKERDIILDVRRENIAIALKQAQQVGMTDEEYKYIIMSLDFHTINLEDFKYGKMNITGYNLIDKNSKETEKLLAYRKKASLRPGVQTGFSINTLKIESALIYDAVKVFSMALQSLGEIKMVSDFLPVSCDNGTQKSHGTSLINLIKSVKTHGLTGDIEFDRQGYRSNFKLNFISLTQNGIEQIGTWTPKGINITTNATSEFYAIQFKNQFVRVTTSLTLPYAMVKNSTVILRGNDRYEGYAVDLIYELSKKIGFIYRFQLVADEKYGALINGTWNGMIGEVLYEKADIAVVDLSITSQRETAVAFTMPFMTTGISILFKKPTEKVTSLFSFLSPFSMEVWIYVIGAYTSVSIVLFLVGRLSPYEWNNPYPCRQEDQVLENNFTLKNCMWFTIGTIMQQGCDLVPSAMSTRTIGGIWSFFTLIMISSYTANLAAFLTVEKVVYPIESAYDLAKQKKIKYGCLGSGSTKEFFRTSSIPTYAHMWEVMDATKPSVFTANNHEGVQRVLAGDYAYLMESASIEYTIERNCQLTQIGNLLDSKHYGIASRKDYPLRSALSKAILELQENGTLRELQEKWWKHKGGGKCSDDGKKSGSVPSLDLGNVGGVFVVLLCGLVLAIIVALIEFFWKARRLAHEERKPICKELIKEVKFALSCRSSTKPVPKKDLPESNSSYGMSSNPGFYSEY